jgi:hypothetical protein
MLVAITKVLDKTVNRHGVPCRVGFTGDYIDEAGVYHDSKLVYTENEAIFDKFVVGLQVSM